MESLNDLLFERLGLIDDYVKEQANLNEVLSSAACFVSKARALNGLALSSVATTDLNDLVPSVFIAETSTGQFELVENENEEETVVNRKSKATEEVKKGDDETEKKDEKKSELQHSGKFRPFGVLEPLSAKQARSQYRNSVKDICRAANIQRKIIDLDVKITSKYNELKQDDLLVKQFAAVL